MITRTAVVIAGHIGGKGTLKRDWKHLEDPGERRITIMEFLKIKYLNQSIISTKELPGGAFSLVSWKAQLEIDAAAVYRRNKSLGYGRCTHKAFLKGMTRNS